MRTLAVARPSPLFPLDPDDVEQSAVDSRTPGHSQTAHTPRQGRLRQLSVTGVDSRELRVASARRLVRPSIRSYSCIAINYQINNLAAVFR